MREGGLRGRTALVTGGGSGIGLAVASRFVDAGCKVMISGRDEAKLRLAADRIARPDQLFYHRCDVGSPEQVFTLVEQTNRRLGRIDILVNNAGINIKKRGVRELTPESWHKLLNANLDGAFYCVHAVLPQMVERQDGLIINVSSTAGKRATPLGGAAYAASKFGMSALSLCLGIEEKDHGIRCSVIYPGEVDTPILAERPQPVTAEQRNRMLRPEDVADAVLFLATLPPHVNVPELIIKPIGQPYA
jgi:NAD(P)-dependent dehydrogenase (short-subunit alcohol dehydrogenase family)